MAITLTVTNATDTTLDLSWTHTDNGQAGFIIEQGTNESSPVWTQVAQVGPDVRFWRATGLTAESPYGYQVKTVVGEIGAISHWPKTIGGSPVTVDADGMLASLVPSIPNGSTLTAWHGAANVWTRIDGTINQDYGNTGPSWDAFTPWEVVFESVSTYDASAYATASAGTITYSIAAGVAGFSVVRSTGIITYDGTVAPGVYWLTLEGTDSNGASLSPELQVSVGSQQMGLITSRITAISQTQATITVDAKTAEGDIHVAVRDSGPYTSTADVKAAVGAVYDQDRPGAFTVPFYANGLTAGTFYYIGLVQVVDGEDSNLLTNAFTTQDDIVYERMGKVPVTRP